MKLLSLDPSLRWDDKTAGMTKRGIAATRGVSWLCFAKVVVFGVKSLWFISRAYFYFIFAYSYIFIKKRDIIISSCKYLSNKVLRSGLFSEIGPSYFYYTT